MALVLLPRGMPPFAEQESRECHDGTPHVVCEFWFPPLEQSDL